MIDVSNYLVKRHKGRLLLLMLVLLVVGFSKNAFSQSLSEILNENAEETANKESEKDEKEAGALVAPRNTRAVYETSFAVGLMGGLNYNFLDNDCYNQTDQGNKQCRIGKLGSSESIQFDAASQYGRPLAVLETRGLGYAARAFFDWSINQSLGVRITGGYEHFFSQDTTKRSEINTSEDVISFNCGTTEFVNLQDQMRCFVAIDYITIEGLVRYKMSSYSDLTPWLGVGIVGLLPIRWNNNILHEPLPPRSGIKVAFGIDINLPDTFLFFPIAFDYTWLYREANNEVRDQTVSLTAGMGFRF